MVIVGDRSVVEERTDSKTTMATSTERSRSLHNFSLPCLKWGGQRHLRCVKAHGDGGGRGVNHFGGIERRSPPASSKPYRDSVALPRKPPESERRRRSFYEPDSFRRSASLIQPPAPPPPLESDGDDGIEAVRKKLMLDLQTEMDKMKFAVLRGGNEEIDHPPPPPATRIEDSPLPEARPWNLRTRRAVCKEPGEGGSGGGKSQRFDDGNCSFSPTRFPMNPPASRIGANGGDHGGIKRPRANFSVSLSKQEIEEDFIAMMGTRPPRRPKKRPRHVQKQMDTQFPGLWLSEITADMYKVNENPEAGKR